MGNKFLSIIIALFICGGVFVYWKFVVNRIKHDGSRTGPKVMYNPACQTTGSYEIYENEKIPYVIDDVLQVFWTQEDIECYERDVLVAKTEEHSSTTDLDPIINCLISEECGGGSQQMKSSLCDKMTCCLLDEGNKFMTKYQCDHYYDVVISSTPSTSVYLCSYDGKTFNTSSKEDCDSKVAYLNSIKEYVAKFNEESSKILDNFNSSTDSIPDWENNTSEGEQILEDIQNIDTTIDTWDPPTFQEPTPTTCYPVIVGDSQGVVCP